VELLEALVDSVSADLFVTRREVVHGKRGPSVRSLHIEGVPIRYRRCVRVPGRHPRGGGDPAGFGVVGLATGDQQGESDHDDHEACAPEVPCVVKLVVIATELAVSVTAVRCRLILLGTRDILSMRR